MKKTGLKIIWVSFLASGLKFLKVFLYQQDQEITLENYYAMHKVNKFIGVVKSGYEVISCWEDLLHVLAPTNGHRMLPSKGKYMQMQTKQGLSDAACIKKVNFTKLVMELIKIWTGL